jgi:hypothetical protein
MLDSVATKLESKEGVPMKKTAVSRLSRSKAGSRSPLEDWHAGADSEFYFYARSLHNAAKTLALRLGLGRTARTDWDACPVILLYRQALELNLKMLVGEGSKFLPSPTDYITLYETHSLRWLAQIVCEIIRAVEWEKEFNYEGLSSLSDFSALVTEVESFDPMVRAIRSSRTGDPDSVSQYYRNFDLVKFTSKLDPLLALLDMTADGLAAMWSLHAEASAAGPGFDGGNDFGPTIQ